MSIETESTGKPSRYLNGEGCKGNRGNPGDLFAWGASSNARHKPVKGRGRSGAGRSRSPA